MRPEDLGRELGISDGEATACLAMLGREGKVRVRLVELSRDALGEGRTVEQLPVAGDGRVARHTPSRVLARMATTGIYLVRGVPADLERPARVRAVSEETTLTPELREGLRECGGNLDAQLDDTVSGLKSLARPNPCC